MHCKRGDMARAIWSAATGGWLALGLLAASATMGLAQEDPRAPATSVGATLGAGGGVLGVEHPGAGLRQANSDTDRPAPGSLPGASLIENLNEALEQALAGRAGAPQANALIAPGMAPVPSPVVVELFTSQGCSACPPADELLTEVARRPDVLALSLHVDYWDYLGWEDPFAQPAFTARQKAYARASGSRTIYTPQMIVGGDHSLVGPSAADLSAMIETQKAEPAKVALHVTDGAGTGQYVIDLSATPPLGNGTVVQIVRYAPQARVEILRGENAGQVLDYTNVVTAWHAVAEWDGKAALRLNAKIDGDEPAVVIVQTALPGKSAPLPGPILAAARLR